MPYMLNKTVIHSDAATKPAKLFIVENNGAVSERLLKNRNLLGRAANDNPVDLQLNSPIVSRKHGEIVSLDGEYFYRDLMSTNGTYINGKLYGREGGKLRTARKLINGDVLHIDSKTGNKPHAHSITMIFSTDYPDCVNWFSQPINDTMAEINIGRSSSGRQNLRLEHEMVSQNHASFFLARLGWAIIDHNSTNGVYVNGIKITEPVYLRDNDVVRIVNMYFVYRCDRLIYQNVTIKQQQPARAPAGVAQPSVHAPAQAPAGSQLFIHITERSVWQKFKKRTLLQNINMTINSGEMVMILGGSGAGKTTFMNAVMGYEKADGRIVHGTTDIYNDYETMKYEIGYVPQQDLLRSSDTVYDTLANAAEMKLPLAATKQQRDWRVHEVIQQLGLSPERESLVSKLSGGQRKRLSIAVEFIANPSLFFLDEPDSGLDGVMAMALHENLRFIADTGKIVMVITHSPDRISKLYDKVIVLAKSSMDNCGYLAFYGSVNEAYRFFDANSLEGVVKRINRSDEGGDGKSDFYIDKYRKHTGQI